MVIFIIIIILIIIIWLFSFKSKVSYLFLQIECMVAAEIMQKYKKLQFERGKWDFIIIVVLLSGQIVHVF